MQAFSQTVSNKVRDEGRGSVTISLTYATPDGTQEQPAFENDVIEIELSKKRIASIDLAPLASCTNLEYLWLDENQLQSIDLAPLVSCASLRKLWFNQNQLEDIDLNPLSSCKSLEILLLDANPIKTVDLTPLFECMRLEVVDLPESTRAVADVRMKEQGRVPSALENLLHDDRLTFV